MPTTVNSLDELSEAVISAFGDHKLAILDSLFENLMITTPEKTGTLKFNWRFKPGGKAGSFVKENTGDYLPDPRKPSEVEYVRNWSQYTVYNNSPYIMNVNDGDIGPDYNKNFIQAALAMTEDEFR